MFLSFCDNPNILQTMKIVRIVIQIIKIAVPLILIISLMITYISAMTSQDNDMLSKANKTLVSKVVAAVLIFLIPTFVFVIAEISSDSLEYMKCISNATDEGVEEARYDLARNQVDRAKTTLLESDYNSALVSVNKIKDEAKKQSLLNELSAVKEKIKQKQQQGNNTNNSNNNNSSNNTNNTNPMNNNVGVLNYSIFMGDSRTNGMKSQLNSSTDYIIAKDGANYTNLDNHFTQAKTILNNNTNTSFNIILTVAIEYQT